MSYGCNIAQYWCFCIFIEGSEILEGVCKANAWSRTLKELSIFEQALA